MIGNLQFEGENLTFNSQNITFGGSEPNGGQDDPRYVAWATANELGKERVRRLLALGYL